MSTNNTPLGLANVKALANTALMKPEGVSVTGDLASMIRLRMQFYQMRKLERRDNKQIYEVGNPMYGHSAFDSMEVKFVKEPDNKATLIFRSGVSALRSFEIIDLATGDKVKVEDL